MADLSGIGSERRGKKPLWIRRNLNCIEDTEHKSVFRVLSSEPSGKSGFSPNFLVWDELAEFPPAHAREVFDRLYDSSAARVDALHITISTAQFSHEHLGYKQYEYAKEVLNGVKTDPTFLPVIYEVEENADWNDKELWWKANPSAGVTVEKSDWIDSYNTAKGNPIDEARFRTLRLNQWCGYGDTWIPHDKWNACISDKTEDDLIGLPCFYGLDFARRYDLCSYCKIIEHEGKVYCFPRFLIPEEIAQKKELLDHVPYRSWEKDPNNKLYFSPGDVIDPAFLRDKMREDFNKNSPICIAFDFWNLEDTRQILEAEGYNLVEINTRSPTLMSPVISHFERLVTKGDTLRHPNNEILNWNLKNCRVRGIGATDGVFLDKKLSNARIDGIVALLVGLSQQMAIPEQFSVSFF